MGWVGNRGTRIGKENEKEEDERGRERRSKKKKAENFFLSRFIDIDWPIFLN